MAGAIYRPPHLDWTTASQVEHMRYTQEARDRQLREELMKQKYWDMDARSLEEEIRRVRQQQVPKEVAMKLPVQYSEPKPTVNRKLLLL